jgi:SecD/SecF fusion protein
MGMLFGGLQGGNRGISLPVLTLPGIAGIALAVGMAVDANVLIFERMREELRAGKGFKAAVDAGFTRAFTAIFDSNMTTIITAIIMFAVGTGAVRGYAVTLTAGLLINLYTAVIVTRMCFDTIGSRTIDTKWLKMFSVIKETRIDFMGLWKYALTVSVVLIAVSWFLMISHGMKDVTRVFGVDFTGGTSLTLSFEQKPNVEEIRSSLSTAGVRDTMIQYQGAMEGGSKEVLMVKVATVGEADLTIKTLAEKFPQADFKVMQQDDVGPQIGSELKKKGFWALGLAMVAMVIYIAIRFEFGFGLGAVAATVHDAAMVIGICHLFGLQLNMTIMAAVLTIIGYSVNDTIVIFDRIRENLRLVRGQSFTDICNLSVNQTLARTLLTNFYTFISVLFLLLMGGGAIKDFSFAMFVGMIAGTYSTVYIATPIVLMWYRFKTPDLGGKSVVK